MFKAICRQDVAYYGVEMTKNPPEPKLTYDNCAHGECVKVGPLTSPPGQFLINATQVHKLQCRRTCDYKDFDFEHQNLVLFRGERLVLAKCRKAYINHTTVQLPTQSPVVGRHPSLGSLHCSNPSRFPMKCILCNAMQYMKSHVCLSGCVLKSNHPPQNPDWRVMAATCSEINIDKDLKVSRGAFAIRGGVR
jgi:hypothetical protein